MLLAPWGRNGDVLLAPRGWNGDVLLAPRGWNGDVLLAPRGRNGDSLPHSKHSTRCLCMDDWIPTMKIGNSHTDGVSTLEWFIVRVLFITRAIDLVICNIESVTKCRIKFRKYLSFLQLVIKLSLHPC